MSLVPEARDAAERLLADDGAGGLVVDVEVAGGVAQGGGHLDDGGAVVGPDGAGEGVGAGGVAQLEGAVEIGVVVDVDGEDRSEELFAHGFVTRILGDDDGRLDEVADRVVEATAHQDLSGGRGLGVFDGAGVVAEGRGVDHRPHEVAKVHR